MAEYPHIIQLKKIPDHRGNLTALEQGRDIPFAIRRVYWIFDVPGGERRGGHAYRHNRELIVALSGSFDVSIDTGTQRDTFTLNRSYSALYVPAGTWRELGNFSTNSLAMIIASGDYDEADYIREYADFEREYASKAADSPDDGDNACPVIAPGLLPAGTADVNTVDDVEILTLDPHHSDRKGDLCVVESGRTVPLDISRVFYLYDVPAGADRGQHAHIADHELIVAASGSFAVTVDDCSRQTTYHLNRPFNMLHLPPGLWVRLHDFSSGAIALVLTPGSYNPDDYIKNYDQLKALKQS